MGGARSGGLTAAGMRVSSGMVFRVDTECCIGTEGIESTRVIGTMGCLTGRVCSTLRMGRSTRGHLRRISFMGTVYFTKMIR